MSLPKVTFIIPVYNGEKTIEKCLDSVTKQTLHDIEIIVLNDGSTDNTDKIISTYAEKDPRILYVSKINEGLSATRNKGLDLASGEFIQHLDGDDWIENDASMLLYEFAKKNDLDIVISDYFREESIEKIRYMKDTNLSGIFTSDTFLEHFFLAHHTSSALWNKLIRRELYKQIRSPSWATFGEDFLAVSKLALNAKKIGKVEKAFTHYIANQNSITKGDRSKGLISFFKVYDEVDNYYRTQNRIDQYQDLIMRGRLIMFSSFITSPPFYGHQGFNDALDYMLSYLNGNNLNIFRILFKFPSKITFFSILILAPLKLIPKKNNFKFLNSLYTPLRRLIYRHAL